MTLTQRHISKAVVTAAIMMKGKTQKELAVMNKQLETEESRVQFSKDLQKVLASVLKDLFEQDQAAFCDDVTARLYSNIQTRLVQK